MDSFDIVRARESNPKRKIFDWISEPRPENITPFQKSILDVDWKNSPAGPISTWPAQLKQMVLLVVQDNTPAVVFWGDKNTIIYNESYIKLIGEKHPALQGQDPKIGFAELWDHFEQLLGNQKETGETVVERNACVMLHRHGFLEETYFTWKFVPIIGPEGWIVGSHETVFEVTREVISDRRLSTVRTLSRELAEAVTTQELWKRLISGLRNAERDIPLALLYSCAATKGAGLMSLQTSAPSISLKCILEGCIGIERGHEFAPENVDLAELDQTVLAQWFQKAAEAKTPVIVSVPERMKLIEWRGITPATQAIVCPLIPINTESVVAFLVLALNPRRPFDDDYRTFIHLLTQQVTTPQFSATVLREEVDHRQNLARQEALHRDRLNKELSESENKFARFAARAPIGLAILKPNGLALSANALWKELTKLDVGSRQVNWGEVLAEGELAPVMEAWGSLIAEKKPTTIQTRIKRPWRSPDLDADGKSQFGDTHILLAMYPDKDESGKVSTVMSCITDISGLKWSENQLRKKMDQAIEMKRQQERFIDMTSHEMRNPLSALIGCADEITNSLRDYISVLKGASISGIGSVDAELDTAKSIHLLYEAIEAAETIIYCAMHQKRIIDDILTLSRLDSNLLIVSPEPSQPIQLVRGALKMFEAEVKRADVGLEFIEQNTIESFGVEWVLLDPSRILQVLINLMTNAIKFTRTEPNRHIKIIIGASHDRPSKCNDLGVEYVNESSNNQDQTGKHEWGDGEVIYLTITVKDTGRGLSTEEKKNLFNLFQQASPKTHVQYGGSGLGLFISKQLTEMQGGQIGVASETGKGSTFQFYVKTRKTVPPLTETPQRNDAQLLVREDALQEACGVEIPARQHMTNMPNLLVDSSLRTDSLIPSLPKIFYILVVEDNLVNQKVVTKQLRKFGHIVRVANHGEEALDFIRRTAYWNGVAGESETLHVVLMDLEMPVMDGISCVRRIREYQAQGMIRWHVPVIAVTANAREDQIMECINAGMDDVTTKPYRMQDMLMQIEKLVAKHAVIHLQT